MSQTPGTPMTEPQRGFLRRLAHEVTGDGDAYVASFLAARGGTATAREASTALNELKARQAAGEKAPPASPTNGFATTSAPVGRYAVTLPGSTGPSLIEITKPTDGRWAGRTFVKTVPYFLGGEAEPVKGMEAVRVLNAVDADPLGCSTAYGMITGHCGLCHRRLKDTTLGIGPECVSRF